MRRRDILALGGTGMAWWAAGGPARAQAGADEPFDAAGYRTMRYRAVVDRNPAPARVLPLDGALRLRPGRNALFLDVLPAEGARRDPASGQWLALPAHATIPGARWFPEVGRAAPDARLWANLVAAVATVRRRHPRWPVVVFCRADCWMSWNAARRLAAAGVPDVLWLAEGIDGWHERGQPLAPATPEVTPP